MKSVIPLILVYKERTFAAVPAESVGKGFRDSPRVVKGGFL